MPRDLATSFLVTFRFFNSGMSLVAHCLFFLRGELYGEASDDLEQCLVFPLELADLQAGDRSGGVLGKPVIDGGFGNAMLFGQFRDRLAGAYAFDDLLLYVRMDMLSGFGHRAAVSWLLFNIPPLDKVSKIWGTRHYADSLPANSKGYSPPAHRNRR